MAIKIVPIYSKKKYFCPLCDNEVKWNQKMHCTLEFDWSGVKKVNQFIRITESIRHDGLKTSVMAKRINYGVDYVAHMLSGDRPMNDVLIEYLVKELEVYIRKLSELKKELKRRIKE